MSEGKVSIFICSKSRGLNKVKFFDFFVKVCGIFQDLLQITFKVTPLGV